MSKTLGFYKNKGEYISQIIKVCHPADANLPREDRRIVFTYKVEIKDIDFDLIESIDNPGGVEYTLKK